MVVQPRKHDPKKPRACADFIWLIKVTLIDPFWTPFTYDIINEVVGHECYSFTDGFSGYNEIPIEKEDQHKTTFVCEFGSFSYKVMPFVLKNAPTIFYVIVIKSFQEYLYKNYGSLFWWLDYLQLT